MDKADQIRREILEKVKEYHHENIKNHKEAFVAGSTPVHYAGRVFDERELLNLIDASLEFWLTYGRFSRQFEERLAQFLGIRHVLVVNSGSSANLLAFMALTSPLLKDRQIRRGDEVITVAAAFPTTVAPIIQYGAVPVFVDVDPHTANIDVARIEEALSPRTKAIMLAHTLGNPFDLHTVKAFCQTHGLWLIEDNCDALGSTYAGRYTGTWGDIGTSSFYPPHHVTMGEGGAVYTDNAQLHKILLSMRDWGRDCWCESGRDNTCNGRFSRQDGSLPFGYDHKYVYSHFGFNLKPTDLQAAIGCAQLEKLPQFIQARKNNFRFLSAGLAPLQADFEFLTATPESDPCWFGFMLTIRDGCRFTRHELVTWLEDHHIQTRNLFAGNITRHPCFTTLNPGIEFRIVGDLTGTDKIMHGSFWIGVYPGLTEAMLTYMIRCVKDFVHQKG